MDLKTLKKAMGVGLLTAAAITTAPAHAADGQVDVDINLPTVLLMYYYSDIVLDIDADTLGNYMVGTNGSPCATSDYCGSNSAGTVTVSGTMTASTDVVGPGLGGPDFQNSTATFNLVDSVGVRAIGCTTPYAADYDVTDNGGAGAITAAADVAITGIDGVACTPALLTGDLSFEVDFGLVPAGDTLVEATLDVTITGS